MTTDLQLSEREREILALAATGASNQQIALQLNISVNTVKVHLRNVFTKIGAASRTEATLYAIRHGLVSVEGSAGQGIPVQESDDPVAEPDPHASEQSQLPVEVTAVLAGSAPGADVTVLRAPSVQTPAGSRRRTLLFGALAAVLLAMAGLSYLLWLRPAVVPTTENPATPASTTAPPTIWRSRAPLPRPRADFAVGADYDDKIYVFGGLDAAGASAAVDRFDPQNNVWAQLTDMPAPVSRVLAVTIGGKLFVPGGEDAAGRILNSFVAFDPRTQQWEQLPALPAARSRYGLAAFEGRLYLFGGWDGQQCRAEVYIYDPADQVWHGAAPMPTPRCDAGAAVLRGRMYLIGGTGAPRANERFDPTDGTQGRWEKATPLPMAVATPAVVEFSNTILTFDPAQHIAAQYTAETDSWGSVPVPPGILFSPRIIRTSGAFVFGPPDGVPPGALNEYRGVFTTYLPGVGR
jgi:DNA-binding CsgD family transcriptional regulator